jgi:hypothetical protein
MDLFGFLTSTKRPPAGTPVLMSADPVQDRVLPETRWLGAVVIPFLAAASVILYAWPNDTGRLFAWPIKPPMTAMMLGAAYIGGIYFFARVVVARRWHTIKAGFWPVTAFASLLGIATLLHWDRFTHNHISFVAWAGLYFTTPFLVFGIWLRNRQTDPHLLAPDDVMLPRPVGWLIGAAGLATAAISLLLFLQPGLMIGVWPWSLSPLTARVVGAMFALPGLVGLGIATDRRWSAARTILEAQAFSIVIILIAAVRARSDFDPSRAATWLFIGGLSALLVGIAIVYVSLEAKRRG